MLTNRLGLAITVVLGLMPLPALAVDAGRVVSVGDGDTIRVAVANKTLTVRLSCVDAPETAQKPWGPAATQQLKRLLPVGQPVTLKITDTDRYGRSVAKVYKSNSSINLAMVQTGQAVVYTNYLSSCPELKDQLLKAEASAKARRIGFWNQANPVLPSDFRRGSRSASSSKASSKTKTRPAKSSTTAKGKCSPAYPGVCIPPSPPDLSCKDIPYRRFKVLPPDPHRFDGDLDGVGCER